MALTVQRLHPVRSSGGVHGVEGLVGGRTGRSQSLCPDQLSEAVGEVLGHDAVLVNVEAAEEQPAEGPLEAVVAAAVAGLGVAEQVKGDEEKAAAGLQAAGGVVQLVLDLGSRLPQGCHFLLQFGRRPVGIVKQVEVAVFLAIELGEPVTEALLDGVEAGQFGLHRIV